MGVYRGVCSPCRHKLLGDRALVSSAYQLVPCAFSLGLYHSILRDCIVWLETYRRCL